METQETQKEDKEKAKKIKEEGNAHYRKKELDLAIQKYDEVILTQTMPNWLHYWLIWVHFLVNFGPILG